jgi:putative hydrolase of the HAD superfamily
LSDDPSASRPPARSWPEAVLFDAAGTLIELRESVGETYARVASQHGVSLPAWRLDDAFRRVLRGAPPRAFPDVPSHEVAARERRWWWDQVRSTFLAADSTVRFDDFDSFFEELFEQYTGDRLWQARAGALECLASLRGEGRTLAVVSNFDQRLPKILEALGMADFLSVTVVPADCGVEKPDPRIFALALEQLGVAAADAAYVGDDPAKDAEGAARAGLAAVDVADLASLAELPARLPSLATLASPTQPPSRSPVE